MNGKLRLSQNEKGGRFRFAMEVTKGNQKLYDRVRSGDLNETSFNFSIKLEDYTMEPDPEYKDKVTTDGRRIIYERIITNVQFLGDVTLTENPAYEGGKEVKACTMCSEGYVMENRGINHRPQNNYESMAEKAAFVEELLRQDAESNNKETKNKMDDNKIKNKAFKQFTGIKGVSENATITAEAIREMDTANIQLVTQLVDTMVLPNPTGFRAQLEAAGVNFLYKGKVNRVNTNSFTVGGVDEHQEFPAFDDLSNLNPATFLTKRIGCTLVISNELLASSNFVSSLIAQADNEIFSDALAFLVDTNIANFATIPHNSFTPEFIQGALGLVGLNGTFMASEVEITPQLFIEDAGVQVVKRTGLQTFETGVSKNKIMWGVDKYLAEPDVAVYGDFRYAFMNVISDLEVVKNTFTYAKSGDTEITFYREIGIAITDDSKFCKSQ